MTRLPLVSRTGARAAAGALCLATACRTWVAAAPAGAPGAPPTPVAEVVAAASGSGPVRLTLRGGPAVVLLTPHVERDSVVGTDARDRARRAVAVADVAGVAAYRVGPVQTAAAVVAGAVAVAVVVYAFVVSQVVRGT